MSTKPENTAASVDLTQPSDATENVMFGIASLFDGTGYDESDIVQPEGLSEFVCSKSLLEGTITGNTFQ